MAPAASRTVLFLCVENAGRSILAEALFNRDPPEGWRALSAGTQPAKEIPARTRTALAEIGLEAPAHPPRLATPEDVQRADRRISMGCLSDDSCPARIRNLVIEDWSLPDPKTLDEPGLRALRGEIQRRVDLLKAELRTGPTA